MYSISKFAEISGLSKTTFIRRWDTDEHLAKIKGITVQTESSRKNIRKEIMIYNYFLFTLILLKCLYLIAKV